jgi:hypothetical protein
VPEEIGPGDGLFPFERVHLERLLLAADVILELAGEGPVSDVLEVELRAFRERVQLTLLRLRFLRTGFTRDGAPGRPIPARQGGG